MAEHQGGAREDACHLAIQCTTRFAAIPNEYGIFGFVLVQQPGGDSQ